MTDNEIADVLVKAGIATRPDHRPDLLSVNVLGYVSIDEALSDWRTAGACLERAHMAFLEKHGKWMVRLDKAYGDRSREWYGSESLPRAICEAFARAQSDTNRIKLAEAMGWRLGGFDVSVWIRPDGSSASYALIEKCFDPFTDANDDYAVLEWARENVSNDRWTLGQWKKFRRGIHNQFRKPWMYEVGDYARAALSVLSSEDKA